MQKGSGRGGTKRFPGLVVRVGFSLAFLGVALWICDWRKVAADIGSLPLIFVLFAWGFYALTQFVSALRWQALLRAKSVEASVGRLFLLYIVGMFANSILPSGLGGDAMKAYCLTRVHGNGMIVLGSVLVERFCGLLAVAALGAMAGLWLALTGPEHLIGALCALAALSIGLGGGLVWLPRTAAWLRGLVERRAPLRLRDKAVALIDTVHSYRHEGRALRRALGLSLLLQTMLPVYYTNPRKGGLIPRRGGIPMRAHLWFDSGYGIEPGWQADGITIEGDARGTYAAGTAADGLRDEGGRAGPTGADDFIHSGGMDTGRGGGLRVCGPPDRSRLGGAL